MTARAGPLGLRLATAALALVASGAGCRDGFGSGASERWAADLVATQQVLFMRLTRQGEEVSGSGSLSSLTSPGAEALTVTGTRRADTLRVTYRRQAAESFRFVGRYSGMGLAGVLDGAEFQGLPVAFRAR